MSGETRTGAKWPWEERIARLSSPIGSLTPKDYDEAWYPGEALITTTLIEKDGSTTLRTTMLMESREARDEVLESGMESGVIVSYDRLEEILSSQGAGKRNE